MSDSLSIANPHPKSDFLQKIALALVSIGILLLLITWAGVTLDGTIFLPISLLTIFVGTVIYAVRTYANVPAGIKNNGVYFNSLTNRGAWGWVAGIVLTGFYVCLYWYPELLGQTKSGNTGIVALFDPLSKFLSGNPASQWFVYGTIYTLAILALGVKFIYKYRHNKYQLVRTISVMFFQLGFAFLIPEILVKLNAPWKDFKNIWPLDYDFFYSYNIKKFVANGGIGLFMLVFGVLMIFIISPILTYFYGKRWYCSWVCGCGGLAETAGDPFRHLSDKSLNAWKLERWLIHGVLVFVIIMTIATLYSFFHNNPEGYWITKEVFLGIVLVIFAGLAAILLLRPRLFKSVNNKIKYAALAILGLIVAATVMAYVADASKMFYMKSSNLRSTYGFLIGAMFSGVIGVGFYPLLGNRVWCRFGCPMAAILGLQQRFFSRFRITTNGGQCISCGNCSTYCEQGIDVRWYAQRGQNIVRASCVGCGICSAVCPRGVLKLENGPLEKRINK